jgi:GntR family transcriptional repressor for pyruvate dehydrogenase complex
LYKAVQPSRLYEHIVQQIEGSIARGQLKTGDQLPAERDLAQQFGVSRTAVREAVRVLSEKGLVEAYSGRGTFVSNLKAGTSQAIRQSLDTMVKMGQQEGAAFLSELREIMEPGIAALAAKRAEESNLTALREAVELGERFRHDPDAFIESDLDFHLGLAEAAGNPLILSLLDSIVGLLREQRMRTYYVKGGPQRAIEHHRRILEAIEHHDAERARETTRAHMDQVREDSRASTDQSPKSQAG